MCHRSNSWKKFLRWRSAILRESERISAEENWRNLIRGRNRSGLVIRELINRGSKLFYPARFARKISVEFGSLAYVASSISRGAWPTGRLTRNIIKRTSHPFLFFFFFFFFSFSFFFYPAGLECGAWIILRRCSINFTSLITRKRILFYRGVEEKFTRRNSASRRSENKKKKKRGKEREGEGKERRA